MAALIGKSTVICIDKYQSFVFGPLKDFLNRMNSDIRPLIEFPKKYPCCFGAALGDLLRCKKYIRLRFAKSFYALPNVKLG